ncbi:MAG TPA: winged helix-turn-helix domain-containing protein [Ktedonobacterales bacterium]
MPNQTGSLILIASHAQASVGLLRSLLEAEGYSTVCAYNGRAARQLIHQSRPALALLDQALPLVDGLELCREVRLQSDAPAVFIMSDRPDELNKLLAFSAGADDYLGLPMHPRELLGRVQVALRRTPAPQGRDLAALRVGAIELRPDQRRACVAGHDIPLTSLEFELLSIFARHPGRVFSRDELLSQLEGFVRGAPLDRAVDIHVSNLRQKLRAALGAAPPIETVRGVGYRMPARNVTPATDEASGARGASLESVALAALDRAPIPLLVLSLDRVVLLYNQAAQELCGWTADEVAGKVTCYSLLGCHSRDGALLCYDACPMRVALVSGVDERQARYNIMLKDGSELTVSASYSRLRLSDAERDCVLLVLQPERERALTLDLQPGESRR